MEPDVKCSQAKSHYKFRCGVRQTYIQKDGENLLIRCLEPPENTQSIWTYSARDLRIITLEPEGFWPARLISIAGN